MELNKELLAKAKETKTPEELMAFAKENNVEMTEESAKAYFDLIHPKTGELSEDELNNVSGGGCHADDGREIVTVCHGCDGFECKHCGKSDIINHIGVWSCRNCGRGALCCNCNYCTYEKALWLCNKSNHRKRSYL